MLFHKVKDVAPLPAMRLSVQFANGATKLYDVKLLIALPRRFNYHQGDDERMLSSSKAFVHRLA